MLTLPDCHHGDSDQELRKLSDLCSEIYCRKCETVVGFSIDATVFGFNNNWTNDIQEKKIEGKVTELSDEDKDKLK